MVMMAQVDAAVISWVEATQEQIRRLRDLSHTPEALSLFGEKRVEIQEILCELHKDLRTVKAVSLEGHNIAQCLESMIFDLPDFLAQGLSKLTTSANLNKEPFCTWSDFDFMRLCYFQVFLDLIACSATQFVGLGNSFRRCEAKWLQDCCGFRPYRARPL